MLSRLLRDHVALVLSALAAITVIAKIWSVAHGGMPAVAAIVSAGDVTSLLGAFLAGLPLVGIVPLFVSGVLLPEAIREGDQTRGIVIATALAIITGFVLAPVSWFIAGCGWLGGMCGLSGLHILLRKAWVRFFRSDPPMLLEQSTLRRADHPLLALAFLTAFAWLAVASSDSPWMPAEDLHTVGGKTLTAYVLDESGDSLLVLNSEDRSVERLAASDVNERIVCERTDSDHRSALSRLVWPRSATYPPCVH